MTVEIITRAEAKARGLKRYFTGKPCKHGHVAERQVGSALCVECVRTHTATWRAANPERERVRQRKSKRRSTAANPEKTRKKNLRNRLKNPEGYRERSRRIYADNREKKLEQARRSRTKKKCDVVIAKAASGRDSAKATGMLMDMRDAINIFKSHDNAFDFVESATDIEF